MRILYTTVLFLLTISIVTKAQVYRGAMLWAGQVGLASDPEPNGLNFSLSPSLQYFVSNRFTIGGQIMLGGTFGDGVQVMVIDPQVRYYLNPEHSSLNWFAFFHSRFFFPVIDDMDTENNTSLFTGVGLNAFLNSNVVLESKLSAVFNDLRTVDISGSAYDLRSPALQLETSLILYLDRADRSDGREWGPNIGKKSWMIGGTSAALHFQAGENESLVNVAIHPKAGYFLSDHIVGGLGFPLGYLHIARDNSFGFKDKLTVKTFGISPFLRYYPGLWGRRIHPFIDLNATFSRNDHTGFGIVDVFQETRNKIINMGGGINLFVSPKAALEAALFLEWDAIDDLQQLKGTLGFQFFL